MKIENKLIGLHTADTKNARDITNFKKRLFTKK